MRLATTPSVTDRYSVAAVVTFGAPVGHLRAGKVPALHVRHAEDGADVPADPRARLSG